MECENAENKFSGVTACMCHMKKVPKISSELCYIYIYIYILSNWKQMCIETAIFLYIADCYMFLFSCSPKGYLHYKTIASQNVSPEAQVKNFLSVLKIFKFLYFQLSHDLPNLRQETFLNLSFEPQLIKSPNVANW